MKFFDVQTTADAHLEDLGLPLAVHPTTIELMGGVHDLTEAEILKSNDLEQLIADGTLIAFVDGIQVADLDEANFVPIPVLTRAQIQTMNLTNVLIKSSDDNKLYINHGDNWVWTGFNPQIASPNPAGYGQAQSGQVIVGFDDDTMGALLDLSASPSPWNIALGTDGTPSSNTGAVVAHEGTHFLYFEASPPLIGPVQTGVLFFDGFANLTEVQFAIHLKGANMGTFRVQAQADRTLDVWTDLISVSTEEHIVANTVPYVKTGADTNKSSSDAYSVYTLQIPIAQSVESIRFIGESGDGTKGDISIDAIKITSVD